METLASIFSTAMAVVVQLGVPVVVIFIMGYTTERATRRRSDPQRNQPPEGSHRERLLAWLASDEKTGQVVSQTGLSRPGVPVARPPFLESELPCWQTAKSTSGRLRGECLGCGAFLAPAVLR